MNQRFRKSPRAMTLTELLLGLTILGFLSIGATNLVVSGLHVDRALLDSNRQVSEMELAIRRMTHNIRTGSTITVTGTNTLSLITQADPNNNGQTYTITYTYDSAAKTLSETSSQYGTTANVIAYNVTSFTVSQVTASPVVISVDITISTSGYTPATRRVFQVLNRNS
ncbi:MAG TPA: hypothetical protein VHM90_17190 [Phycisphaerae bacterium]|nr:hypothetical protein [Phycisphaerae bacterium]